MLDLACDPRMRLKEAVMAYDEALAERVRQVHSGRDDIVERRMMGALCFMAGGHMCCGVSDSSLMVRVGREAQEQILAMPHVQLMEIGGQPVAGFVLISMGGFPLMRCLPSGFGAEPTLWRPCRRNNLVPCACRTIP